MQHQYQQLLLLLASNCSYHQPIGLQGPFSPYILLLPPPRHEANPFPLSIYCTGEGSPSLEKVTQ